MNANKSVSGFVEVTKEISEKLGIQYCTTMEESLKHFNEEELPKLVKAMRSKENEFDLIIEERLTNFINNYEYEELQQIYEIICNIKSSVIRNYMKEAFGAMLAEIEEICEDE